MQEGEAYIVSAQRLDAPNGESAAREMEDVLSRRLPSFYRSAYRFLGNPADAEDAVQEALLSAYARMQLRRRPSQIHVSLDERIGEEQDYSMSELLADRGPTPEDECRNSELNARLRQLAAQLSPPLRKAFQLRDLDGLTTSEAANLLGVADGTVKAQVARARAKLRQLMRRGLEPQRRAALTCTALPSTASK